MKFTAAKGKSNPRVIPGFGLTLGTTLAFLSLLILIPLASVLVYSFSLTPAEFWEILLSESVVWSFVTTIGCALIAALINCVFGTYLSDSKSCQGRVKVSSMAPM